MASPAESGGASSTTETSREVLAGLIEPVTFHSPANGFCVLRIKATFLHTSPPTSAKGMAHYLGSRMIRGIGPFYAGKVINLWSSVGGLQTTPISRHHAEFVAEAYRMAT